MSDRWLYRIAGREFGPVSLDLVRTLVAAGTIAQDDEVRDAMRSTWILAGSATELRGSIQTPVSDLVAERRAVRDEWYCRGAFGQLGPLQLTDLIQLAVDGTLRPEEEVKAWKKDYWKQVRSIQRLLELLPFPDGEDRNRLDGLLPFDEAARHKVCETQNVSKIDSLTDDEFPATIPFPGSAAPCVTEDSCCQID